MIKILYDHQMFDKQEYGGISRYFVNLLTGVEKEAHILTKVSVLFTTNHYLKAKAYGMHNSKLAKLFFSKRGRLSKWNKNYSKYCILKNDFDVFHPTYYHPYFLKWLKKPLVITVHDMIYELYPGYFDSNDFTADNKKKLVEKAAHIIAISQTTKDDLVRLLKVPKEKITVVYHGHTPIANVNKPDMLLPKEYILFVGSRENYKNFNTLCHAIAVVMQKNPGLKLICAGGGKLTKDEKIYLNELKIADRVIQYNVSDDALYWLYEGARAFVYPSLYEGFGLPILEAFEANCPVILSNTSSFREVGAQAALYFEATDFKGLSDSIHELLSDNSLREVLISEGKERLKIFSMEKCVNETIEVYRKCLKL